MQPSQRLDREKRKALERGYAASGAHIAAFNEGRLALQPGCDAAQTLEAEITGELNRIREEAGKVGGAFSLRRDVAVQCMHAADASILGDWIKPTGWKWSTE